MKRCALQSASSDCDAMSPNHFGLKADTLARKKEVVWRWRTNQKML